jgi:multicomponent Na+:H+ antiporter subunit G
VSAIFFDVMVILSLTVMTLGIVGILRMPDIYTKLHGASKSVFLGIALLTLSATVVSTPEMTSRIILITLLVVMTTPISSHVIGHAAYRLQERMETPGAIDESHLLVPDGEPHDIEEPTWRL